MGSRRRLCGRCPQIEPGRVRTRNAKLVVLVQAKRLWITLLFKYIFPPSAAQSRDQQTRAGNLLVSIGSVALSPVCISNLVRRSPPPPWKAVIQQAVEQTNTNVIVPIIKTSQPPPTKKCSVGRRRRQLDMDDGRGSLCIRCLHLAPLSMESGGELYKCPPNNRLSDETCAPRQLAL